MGTDRKCPVDTEYQSQYQRIIMEGWFILRNLYNLIGFNNSSALSLELLFVEKLIRIVYNWVERSILKDLHGVL